MTDAGNPEVLKIGLVFDDSLDRPDGVQQYVSTLGEWLLGQGHDVHYLVGGANAQENPAVHVLSRNASVKFNGNKLSTPIGPRMSDIRGITKDKPPFDVFHVQMPYSPFMGGLLVRRAPEQAAVVGTFHIMPFSRLHAIGNRLLGAAQSRSLKRFDDVASVSAPAQAFARSHYGIDSAVIPCPIDVKTFQLNETPAVADDTIVFVGRLVERKGVEQLLYAFSELTRLTDKKPRLVICGDGPLRGSLEKLANDLALGLQVEIRGFVSQHEKVRQLASASIAVFPSLGGESFGIVLLEAMAAGSKVVLGGDNAGYGSVLKDSPGQLFNPRVPKDFAKVLQHFLDDKTAIQKAHDWQTAAIEQYDIPVVGKQILAMYHQAIAKRR